MGTGVHGDVAGCPRSTGLHRFFVEARDPAVSVRAQCPSSTQIQKSPPRAYRGRQQPLASSVDHVPRPRSSPLGRSGRTGRGATCIANVLLATLSSLRSRWRFQVDFERPCRRRLGTVLLQSRPSVPAADRRQTEFDPATSSTQTRQSPAHSWSPRPRAITYR